MPVAPAASVTTTATLGRVAQFASAPSWPRWRCSCWPCRPPTCRAEGPRPGCRRRGAGPDGHGHADVVRGRVVGHRLLADRGHERIRRAHGHGGRRGDEEGGEGEEPARGSAVLRAIPGRGGRLTSPSSPPRVDPPCQSQQPCADGATSSYAADATASSTACSERWSTRVPPVRSRTVSVGALDPGNRWRQGVNDERPHLADRRMVRAMCPDRSRHGHGASRSGSAPATRRAPTLRTHSSP